MRVTILGSGTSLGVPIISCPCEVCRSSDPRDRRLRSAALLEWSDMTVAIDIGPDFRQQMLNTGTKMVHALLITHEHNDHTNGLDEVRPFNFQSRNPMPLYATEKSLQHIRRRFAYAFSSNPYPGVPSFDLHPIEAGKPFYIGGHEICPIEVMHGQLPVTAFRIGDFAYVTDAKTVSKQSLRLLAGTKVMVVNALRKKEHHSHFNLHQALDFIAEVGAKRAYLTHLSHEMGLHRTVDKLLPSGVSLAYDGLQIDL